MSLPIRPRGQRSDANAGPNSRSENETRALDPKYIPVDLRHFAAGRTPLIDLYIQIGEDYILYCRANSIFSDQLRVRLIASGIETLYTPLPLGITSYRSSNTEPNLHDVINIPDSRLSLPIKARILYHSALDTARIVYTAPQEPESIENARRIVATTISLVGLRNDALPLLLEMMRHDSSIYSHAVNVCTYATALGVHIGLGDDDLFNLSLGAFLHDLGKTRVPDKILTKPGRLTTDEWSIIKRHPEWGIEIASSALAANPKAMTVIIQHHERCNGTGYPRGIVGASIDRLACLVALVDAYDALTAERYGRAPYTPFAALRIIRDEMQGQFDLDAFVAFVCMLGPARDFARETKPSIV